MLKVVYCSWLLLLWLTALYVVTGLGGQDDTLRCFRVFATFPSKLFLPQEPEKWGPDSLEEEEEGEDQESSIFNCSTASQVRVLISKPLPESHF